jgi:glycerol-3-phosphate acyltransferase PlsY
VIPGFTTPTWVGLAIVLIAYIIGTIPFGVLFARWMGATDPRTAGSGNIGFTNVWRVSGKSAAALTLLTDVAKGAVPVWAAGVWLPATSGWAQTSGIAAVLGHVFPVWTGFRGGKGVATGIGALAILSPASAISVVGLWILILGAFRYVSLASVVAAAALPVIAVLTSAREDIFAVAVGVLIIAKHRDNLLRLRQGSESKLGTHIT